mmetsp:Transcript_56565/g.132701  ORF Transcript_56565/g.132701 Transcript_56565/m.132701 type:complete len:96 (+) Transcript_56565:717-1004(+)
MFMKAPGLFRRGPESRLVPHGLIGRRRPPPPRSTQHGCEGRTSVEGTLLVLLGADMPQFRSQDRSGRSELTPHKLQVDTDSSGGMLDKPSQSSDV